MAAVAATVAMMVVTMVAVVMAHGCSLPRSAHLAGSAAASQPERRSHLAETSEEAAVARARPGVEAQRQAVEPTERVQTAVVLSTPLQLVSNA